MKYDWLGIINKGKQLKNIRLCSLFLAKAFLKETNIIDGKGGLLLPIYPGHVAQTCTQHTSPSRLLAISFPSYLPVLKSQILPTLTYPVISQQPYNSPTFLP